MVGLGVGFLTLGRGAPTDTTPRAEPEWRPHARLARRELVDEQGRSTFHSWVGGLVLRYSGRVHVDRNRLLQAAQALVDTQRAQLQLARQLCDGIFWTVLWPAAEPFSRR